MLKNALLVKLFKTWRPRIISFPAIWFSTLVIRNYQTIDHIGQRLKKFAWNAWSLDFLERPFSQSVRPIKNAPHWELVDESGLTCTKNYWRKMTVHCFALLNSSNNSIKHLDSKFNSTLIKVWWCVRFDCHSCHIYYTLYISLDTENMFVTITFFDYAGSVYAHVVRSVWSF